MINSAKEARDKLVEHLEKKCPCQNFHITDHVEAAGYLAGLTGPEVKALVEALDFTHERGGDFESVRLEALAKYREAVKL